MGAHLGASHLPQKQQKHQTGGTGAVTWHWVPGEADGSFPWLLNATPHSSLLGNAENWLGSPEAVPWQQQPLLRAHSSSSWLTLGDVPELCSCMHVQTHWFTHLLMIKHFQEFPFLWKSYFWAVMEHPEAQFPWLTNVSNGGGSESCRTAQQALTYQEHEEHVLAGRRAPWVSNPGILQWLQPISH